MIPVLNIDRTGENTCNASPAEEYTSIAAWAPEGHRTGSEQDELPRTALALAIAAVSALTFCTGLAVIIAAFA